MGGVLERAQDTLSTMLALRQVARVTKNISAVSMVRTTSNEREHPQWSVLEPLLPAYLPRRNA